MGISPIICEDHPPELIVEVIMEHFIALSSLSKSSFKPDKICNALLPLDFAIFFSHLWNNNRLFLHTCQCTKITYWCYIYVLIS